MWNAKLAATGKGYRYAWSHRSPHLSLHPPGVDLRVNQTFATDDQIEDWIAKRVAGGEKRDDIEAALKARIHDVANGYEDRFHARGDE